MRTLSTTEAVWLVSRREFTERLRDKSFIVSTITVVVIVLAVLLLPQLLGFGGPTSYEVGIVGPADRLEAAVAQAQPAFEARVTIVELPDRPAAEAALAEGEVAVAVLADGTALAEEALPPRLDGLLQVAWTSASQLDAAAAAGLDPEQTQAVLSPAPLSVEVLGEEREDLAGVAFLGMMILYGQLFGYGFWVAMGIVEEKSTRVVEVLLSTIRPRHLLAGKVLGIGALGLLQLLLISGLGLGGVIATGVVDVPAGTGAQIVQLVVWFVLGFAFYASLFATAAALVARQEELQNAMTPISMVVLVSFFAAFAALENPAGTLARVVSLLPPSAPLAMPIRMATTSVPWWEVGLAVGGIIVAAAALVPLAGRVYEGAALRTGGRTKLSQALRSGAPSATGPARS